jgi:hypothetical protein
VCVVVMVIFIVVVRSIDLSIFGVGHPLQKESPHLIETVQTGTFKRQGYGVSFSSRQYGGSGLIGVDVVEHEGCWMYEYTQDGVWRWITRSIGRKGGPYKCWIGLPISSVCRNSGGILWNDKGRVCGAGGLTCAGVGVLLVEDATVVESTLYHDTPSGTVPSTLPEGFDTPVVHVVTGGCNGGVVGSRRASCTESLEGLVGILGMARWFPVASFLLLGCRHVHQGRQLQGDWCGRHDKVR